MNIKDFKKGEIITRIEPVKEMKSDTLGFMSPSREEKNYTLIGKPIKLIGIANGMIYYTHVEEGVEEAKNPSSIVYDKFNAGWEEYIDPKSL